MCRSPMAEGIACAGIERDFPGQVGRVEVSSAGTGALLGNPPARDAVEAMQARGVDISGHRARSISEPVVAASDLVLTMEEEQSAVAKSLTRAGDTPVFLLLELGEAAQKYLNDSAVMTAADCPLERLAGLVRLASSVERKHRGRQRSNLYEVADPIGMPREEYERIIDVMVGPINDILRALLGQNAG